MSEKTIYELYQDAAQAIEVIAERFDLPVNDEQIEFVEREECRPEVINFQLGCQRLFESAFAMNDRVLKHTSLGRSEQG